MDTSVPVAQSQVEDPEREVAPSVTGPPITMEQRAESIRQLADNSLVASHQMLKELNERFASERIKKIPDKQLVTMFVMMSREVLRLMGRADVTVDHRYKALIELSPDEFKELLAGTSSQ